MALGAAAFQELVPTTEEWLRVTGQDVRVDKSCSSVQGEQGAAAVLLRGGPIPLATTFRQLGVDIAIPGSKTTGPVLSRRLEAGRSALRRLPHLSTYDRRERAISTLVTPLALHGVAVAPVTEPDLRGLETAVVQALWGPARVSRAKEVIFTVLSKGHRVSPNMHTRYERLLWLARLARRPGVTQVFAQAIWESGGRPPRDGPGGARALHGGLPGRDPTRGLVVLGHPRGAPPLHLVQEPLRQLQHRVRDSLRRHSLRQLEARRPVTFGGLGDRADGPACRAALRAASTELEKSLLRGLLTGPMWTAARVSGHGTRAHSACPHCGAAHEDEAHVVWECPEWDKARGRWLPWLNDAAGAIPNLGPPDRWPSCLEGRPFPPPAGTGGGPGPPRRVLVLPIWHVLGGPRCPYGSQPGGPTGPRRLPLSGAAGPRPHDPYPWDDFAGPLPGDTVRPQPRLQPGVPPDWRWPHDFVHDLVRWARALAWMPGPAKVSWAELALDYEVFLGRALPPSPDHRLRGTRLPLRERVQILRKAVGLAERRLAAAALLSGAPLGRYRSLLPLGHRVCAGRCARPYFATRHEVMLQLMRLGAHSRDSWVRRLRAPARMQPLLSDRFMMD